MAVENRYDAQVLHTHFFVLPQNKVELLEFCQMKHIRNGTSAWNYEF